MKYFIVYEEWVESIGTSMMVDKHSEFVTTDDIEAWWEAKTADMYSVGYELTSVSKL